LIKEQHVPFLVSSILTRKVYEKNTNDIDFCLGGLMDMVRLEIIKTPALRNEIKTPTISQKESLRRSLTLTKRIPKMQERKKPQQSA
jgi:hypothetical protein